MPQEDHGRPAQPLASDHLPQAFLGGPIGDISLRDGTGGRSLFFTPVNFRSIPLLDSVPDSGTTISSTPGSPVTGVDVSRARSLDVGVKDDQPPKHLPSKGDGRYLILCQVGAKESKRYGFWLLFNMFSSLTTTFKGCCALLRFYSEERQAQRRESRRMRMEDKLSRAAAQTCQEIRKPIAVHDVAGNECFQRLEP